MAQLARHPVAFRAQQGFRRLALGDVMNDRIDQPPTAQHDGVGIDQHLAHRAVGQAMAEFETGSARILHRGQQLMHLAFRHCVDVADLHRGQRRAVVAVKLAGRTVGLDDAAALRIHQPFHCEIRLEHRLVAVGVFAQLFDQPRLIRLPAPFFQRPAHRRPQPRDAVFQHIIIGARLDAVHRPLLIQRAGDHDEGHRRRHARAHRQRVGPGKGGQRIVGENEIGRLRGDRRLHLRAVLHPFYGESEAVALQLARDQRLIEFLILDQEDAQGRRG